MSAGKSSWLDGVRLDNRDEVAASYLARAEKHIDALVFSDNEHRAVAERARVDLVDVALQQETTLLRGLVRLHRFF